MLAQIIVEEIHAPDLAVEGVMGGGGADGGGGMVGLSGGWRWRRCSLLVWWWRWRRCVVVVWLTTAGVSKLIYLNTQHDNEHLNLFNYLRTATNYPSTGT